VPSGRHRDIGSSSFMRRRQESPIQPFDVVPQSVVDAARRLFDAVRGSQGTSRAWVSLVDRLRWIRD
jgi:hypothetical protein